MKDKKSVLVELEQLKSVGDELTQEVAHLTTELEKERSQVHALKEELSKENKAAAAKDSGKDSKGKVCTITKLHESGDLCGNVTVFGVVEEHLSL